MTKSGEALYTAVTCSSVIPLEWLLKAKIIILASECIRQFDTYASTNGKGDEAKERGMISGAFRSFDVMDCAIKSRITLEAGVTPFAQPTD